MCYPGHCRLLLELPAIINKAYIYKALCYDENGRPLLCSDLFVNLVSSGELMPFEVRHERAGPSMPCSLYDSIHIDLVYSLHCQCPRILQRWAERRRHWPSTDIVQKVVSLGAYVSPVGFKGSEYRRVEWRICFNTGENELVSNLNNIQVYMYVILKMVVKDVLKPVKKEISSYTVKNIVLWLAEKNSQTLFHEGSLLYWVHRGLGKLKTAILTERLSYYMIPKRNLMAACGLNGEQKRTWVATINDMMNEGSKLILRLPKIRRAILSHPEPLMWYSMKRVELELLDLKIMNREQVMHQNMVDNESDPMLLALNRRKDEILREVQERMGCEGCRANDLEAIYNMMLM
ncbi:hypothetical protein DPMN_038894 [Dreissena polymorpha]|uniref:Uncharacterized protein n=2 Tax=Dreissena polymorpha TaxID=45954 RepID=A0A9D4RQT0_DREPO|nr:hypothetical protein DPMN_038894 [Dreissena polymorpha]